MFGISGSREKLRFDKGKYVFVARRRMGFSPFFGRGGKMEGVKERWTSSRFGKRFDSLFRGDFEVSRLTWYLIKDHFSMKDFRSAESLGR